MNIIITHHGDNFNVELASKEGAEPFLSIKGCRLVEGQKGPFVSYPATKNQTTGKWWSHVWASEKFNQAVLEKVQASMPAKGAPRRQQQDDDSSIPF